MASENNSNNTTVINRTETTKLRFIDLVFIIFYTVSFVCFLLNFIGVIHYYETYFTATWFVFPFIIQLLATRLITLKEILFSKFPLTFKPLLRNILLVQFAIQHAVFFILQEYPAMSAQISNMKIQFLINNALLIVWSFYAIYQKFTTKKPAKENQKK